MDQSCSRMSSLPWWDAACAMRGRRAAVLVFCILLLLCPSTQDISGAAPIASIKRSSSAITITADGSLVLAVNPDSNSLSLVDTSSETILVELSVGSDPRTVAVDDAGSHAYVANRGSDDLTVVDLATQSVIATLPLGDRPYGVVVSPDGCTVYVSEQGADRVSVIDTATMELVSSYDVHDRPSGLAISDDGKTLVITHLLEGDLTFIPLDQQVIYLPVIVRGSPPDQIMASSPTHERRRTDLTELRRSTIDLWPDSNLAQSVVIGPDGHTAYVPHTRSNSENRALTFDTTVFPLVSLIDIDTRTHVTGTTVGFGNH